MLTKISDIEEYNTLVARYKSKATATNNYMMPSEISEHISEGTLSAIDGSSNLFILLDKGNCQRLYYYINDINEACTLPDGFDYAVEILYRGDDFYPEKEMNYLLHSGFAKNLIRDFYTGKSSEMIVEEIDTDISIVVADNDRDVRFAINLFNRSFDAYTGDFIRDQELPSIIEDGSISVAKSPDGAILGACHAYDRNRTKYLGHLAVIEECRGKHIGRMLMSEMIKRLTESDKTRFTLWVQRNNQAAIRLYESLGYKYASKSTISLLKIKRKQIEIINS